jgi:hypothetical protein
MIFNHTSTEVLIISVIIFALFIVFNYYRFLLNLKLTGKGKVKQRLYVLEKLAVVFIWLIGLSIGFMMFSLTVDWYTVDTLLWMPFEITLSASLAMLFLISIAITYYGKESRSDIKRCFTVLVKHLIAQMILITLLALSYAIKITYVLI